jgi:6-pyruvoyl-tetrahydropterin synthase
MVKWRPRVIVGIHGLGKKPLPKVLKKWWYQAISEGLQHINHPGVFFRFELVYWADILHPQSLKVTEKDPKSPQFIEFPYVPARDFTGKPPGKLRRKFLDFLEKNLDRIFMKKDMTASFQSVTDLIIRHYFKDLDLYYTSSVKDKNGEERPARELIRQRLIDILKKYHKNEMMLIAHSMGSIISFEVLKSHENELEIDTLVTIGSPLGQPVVMSKILAEFQKTADEIIRPQTPENIRNKWFNHSDLEDNVAMNYNLADDYDKNSTGIQPEDSEVYNNYTYEQKRNPHKSYGYLRTPEISEIIFQFLSRDRTKFGFWLSNRFVEYSQKFFKQ